ncbi:protein DBF4 B [Mactra antiquata]
MIVPPDYLALTYHRAAESILLSFFILFHHNKIKPSPFHILEGQALLLKASKQSNLSVNSKNYGLVQSASNLGVKVQTPSQFLHTSCKLLSKLKALAENSKQGDPLCGMSPILWDEDKENLCVIKVEDEDRVFRPLLKHFDKFPEICYSEDGSPFHVGVVLTKHDENLQSKKKTTNCQVQFGGYCESCDHWYKCNLREHLNSNKHAQFTAKVENFESLNQMTMSLPNIKSFVSKFDLKHDNSQKNHMLNDRPSNSCIYTEMQKNALKISERMEIIERSIDKVQLKSSETALRKFALFNELNYNSILANSVKSDSINSCSSLPRQSKDSQRYSIDDVLRNITDDASPTDIQNIDISIKLHGIDAEPSGPISNIESQNLSRNTGTNSSRTDRYYLDMGCAINQEKITTTAVTNIPFQSINQDTNFSSSSFSFGDTGVNKVISILNESDRHFSEPFNFNSVSNFFPNHNDQTFNCLETMETGDRENLVDAKIVQNGNHKHSQSSQISKVSKCEEDELQRVINVFRNLATETGVNNDRIISVTEKKSSISSQIPEYSNTSKESNHSKPRGVIKTNIDMNQMSSLNSHSLSFDTELFCTDVTPSKDTMNSLRETIHKENASSGSTIKNWLIPVDDILSVASPIGLNNTLMEKNIEAAVDIETLVHEGRNTANVPAGVGDIFETAYTSKVAAGIQSNISDTKVDMNVERSVEDSTVSYKCVRVVDKPNDGLEIIDDVGIDESCSVRKYDTYHNTDAKSNFVWSHIETSISDCTLPDSHASTSRENVSITEESCQTVTNTQVLDSKDSDNIGVKSGLSSCVTVRGIKISGLSTLKSDYSETSNSFLSCYNLYPSERNNVIKESSTMSQDCMNSWSSYNNNSILLKTSELLKPSNIDKQSEHIPACQNSVQNVYNASVLVTSDQNIFQDSSQHSDIENKFQLDYTAKERKANCHSVGHYINHFQPIGSAFQTTNVDSICQVNSVRSGSCLVNQFGTKSCTSINMPSESVENMNAPAAQSYTSNMFSPGHNGNSVMDLLLSPGLHLHNNHAQMLNKQSIYLQSGYQGTTHSLNDHVNPNISSSNVNICGLNPQQHIPHRINNTIPSDPLQNSNVMPYCIPHSITQSNISNIVSKNPWNPSATFQQSMYLSQSSSSQGEHLQTIDLSHIAEGNTPDYTNHFHMSEPSYKQTNENKTLTISSSKHVRKSTCLSTRNAQLYGSSSPMIYNEINSNPVNIGSTSLTPAGMINQYLPFNAQFSSDKQTNQWKQNYVPQLSNSQCLSPHASNSVTPFNNMHNYSSNHQQYQQAQNLETLHNGGVANSSVVYNTVQTGDMKLTFRKVSVIDHHKLEQSKHGLMHNWNVRKAGDCRLVFSNNMRGKRKAKETSTKDTFIEDSSNSMSQPMSKRQRCLIY